MNDTKSPYVGPVALDANDAIFGRDDEIAALFGLVASRRIVLLHAPSGAGKSSVLRAGTKLTNDEKRPPVGLIAKLAAKKVECIGPIRVGIFKREHERLNRFVASAIDSLHAIRHPDPLSVEELTGLTLRDYIVGHYTNEPDEEDTRARFLLVIDQFEELITADVMARDARREFMNQLGRLLEDPRVCAVIAMRTDYVGALDPYVSSIPDQLRARFYLELFTAKNALPALVGPARMFDVTIDDTTANDVVAQLARTVVQRQDQDDRVEDGFIEPLHLQLVAQYLWSKKQVDKKIVLADDDPIRDIDTVLGSYYDDCVEKAGMSTCPTMAVRAWIDTKLITPQGVRTQLTYDAVITDIPEAVLEKLLGSTLLRQETRGNRIWIELSHDRLIGPIHSRNRQAEVGFGVFYDRCIRQAATDACPEETLRQWIENDLIKGGKAVVVPRSSESSLVPLPVIEKLVELGLLRERERNGPTIELVHESLIPAIQARNREAAERGQGAAVVVGIATAEETLGDFYDRCIKLLTPNPSKQMIWRSWIGALADGAATTPPPTKVGVNHLLTANLIASDGEAGFRLARTSLDKPVRTRNARAHANYKRQRSRRLITLTTAAAITSAMVITGALLAARARDTALRDQIKAVGDAVGDAWRDSLSSTVTKQASTNLATNRPLSALAFLEAVGNYGEKEVTAAMRALAYQATRNLWKEVRRHGKAVHAVATRSTDADFLIVSVDESESIFELTRDGAKLHLVDDRLALDGVRIPAFENFDKPSVAAIAHGLIVAGNKMSYRISDASGSKDFKLSIDRVAISVNENAIAVVSGQKLRIHHGDRGTEMREMDLGASKIVDLAISYDGLLAVVADADDRVRVFTRDGVEIASTEVFGVERIVYSPHPLRFAVVNRLGVARIMTLAGGDTPNADAGFTRAELKSSPPLELGQVSEFMSVQLPQRVDDAGVAGGSDAVPLPPGERSGDSHYDIASLVWTPDGDGLLVAGPGQLAAMFNARDGARLASFEEGSDITAAAVLDHGGEIVLGTRAGTVRRWNAEPAFAELAAPPIRAATFGALELGTTTNVLLTLNSKCGLAVWAMDGTEIERLAKHVGGTPRGVALVGSTVLVVCDRVYAWDVKATIRIPFDLGVEGPGNVVFGHDPHRFASFDGQAVLAWRWSGDLRTRAERRLRVELPAPVAAVAFTTDDTKLVITTSDGSVHVQDLENTSKALETLSGAMPLYDRLFAPLSPLRVGSTSYFDAEKKKLLIVSGGSDAPRLWDGDGDGDEVHAVFPISFAAMTSDGRHVVTSIGDESAQIWDRSPRAGAAIRHDLPINRIDLDHSGGRVMTSGLDGKVQIWDVETGTSIANMQFDGDLDIAGFDPSGSHLFVSGNKDARIYDVRLDSSLPEEWAKLRVKCGFSQTVLSPQPVLQKATPKGCDRDFVTTDVGSARRQSNLLRAAISALPDRAKVAIDLLNRLSKSIDTNIASPYLIADEHRIREVANMFLAGQVPPSYEEAELMARAVLLRYRADLAAKVYESLDQTSVQNQITTIEALLLARRDGEAIKAGKAFTDSNLGYVLVARMVAFAATALSGGVTTDSCKAFKAAYTTWAATSKVPLGWNWSDLQFMLTSTPVPVSGSLVSIINVLNFVPDTAKMNSLLLCAKAQPQ